MMLRLLLVSSSLVVLGACTTTPAPAPVVPPAVLALKPPPPNADAGAELHALLDAEWQRHLRESPEDASANGDRRYNDRWSDLSLAAFEASHEADIGALKALLEIDRERLSEADQLNFDLFKQQLSRSIEGYRYRHFLMPLNQLGGIQTLDQFSDQLRFQTIRDYEDWIARLRGIDALVAQVETLMRTGVAEGRTPPRIIMQRVPAQIDKQIVAKPEDSLFYAPLRQFPADFTPEVRARLAAEARAAIAGQVIPAYRRLRTTFVKDYLPKCRDSIAASALPDGADDYAFAAASQTTTSMTPDEIHALGLREVARIRAEMEKIRVATHFKGDLKAFFKYLRSDPRFFHKDGEELLRSYRDIAKRIDGELPKLFGKLPRLPYGVKPIPAASAPDVTTAYYQPGAADGSRAGTFYANLYRPRSRPIWEQEALTAHEAMPGHHLQIALQQELGEVPEFRKQASYTAFVEGWGLYSESLGSELGLYQDPYSRFGQLTYEMWRAVRLVVDTGMHAKGWSRQQAIDYFKANTPRAELDITNEIDRYIADPGQALAYKIGELKIKELRARARERLGERFDLRAFHDTVLRSGAVPLDVLERQVDAWIASVAAAHG